MATKTEIFEKHFGKNTFTPDEIGSFLNDIEDEKDELIDAKDIEIERLKSKMYNAVLFAVEQASINHQEFGKMSKEDHDKWYKEVIVNDFENQKTDNNGK